MFNVPVCSAWPRRWLQLAVLALAFSGVFSIILVIARTPQLIALFPWMKELFGVSLVIHVDLSVLVWFLAMTGLLWSMLSNSVNAPKIAYADAVSWGAVLAGVLLMAGSPLTGEWTVIKSNYVPVMVNAVFLCGLALVLAGMVAAMLQAFLALPKTPEPIALGVYGTLPIMLVALCCFALSARGIPPEVSGLAFYENLFWAGGHLLQFVYVQIMLVAWVVLASAIGLRTPPKGFLAACLALGPLASLLGFLPYLRYEVMSQEHMDAFSLLMNGAMGISGAALGLWYLSVMLRQRPAQYGGLWAALVSSFLLFVVGGAFGAAINGPNVRIPAHYHGSIVAVTLALMGLAYYLLPKLGGQEVSQWRSARLQPWFYGTGQLLHITGLAISGGYGVLRKSVGNVGSGGWEVKAALGMMGGGGLLAIIGGLVFVIVMVKGFRRCHVSSNVE